MAAAPPLYGPMVAFFAAFRNKARSDPATEVADIELLKMIGGQLAPGLGC